MVRIPGFHPGDPGSSPGVGTIAFGRLVVFFIIRREITNHRRLSRTGRGYGATVARLTPDEMVGRSNRSGLIFFSLDDKRS